MAALDNELLDGFYLNDWLVEPLTGQVSRASGETHLPSKAVEVLLFLAKHPRRLVTREELLAKVWGDGHGSNEALSHAVGDIRRALDDHADNPVFIQTVPTRGYRLLVEPTMRDAGKASTPHKAPVRERGFWARLVRHGVVQASAAYLVTSWLLVQIADVTFDNLGLPAWAGPLVTYTIIGGFPIVVLLTWFFEFYDGRVKLDSGRHSGGVLKGLERNYIAIFLALGISLTGASVYQVAVGFDVDAPPPASQASLLDDPELLPVLDNAVAVLKLVTFDDSETSRMFADGLSEDLIDGLARLPGLFVSSRGDSWSLPANAPSDTVRRRLRVARYVEGSVRLSGGRLNVVVQLIDSDTGFHVMSRKFERDITEFPALQEEIAGVVVANLRPALDEDTAGRGLLVPDPANVDAYVLYRRGLEILYEPRTPESIAAASAMFSEALELDPAYPVAHAGLCSASTALFEITRSQQHIEAAEQYCAQAYSNGPRLTQVLNALGRFYVVTGRDEEAEEVFRDALQIDAQNSFALRGLASLARRAQRFDEAVRLMTRAIELQPGNWNAMTSLGNLYFRVGKYDEAVAQYRKVVYLSPDNFVALGNLGSASLMAGEFEIARSAIERSIEIEPNPTFYSNLGIVHYYLGEFGESVAVHRRVVELSPESHASWLNLADALHFAGETEAATEAFAKAAELSEIQLAINPTDPEAITLLAWSKAMLGDMDDAVALAESAVQIDEADPYSHYYLALTRLKNGEPQLAIESLETALQAGYSARMLAADPYLQDLRTNPELANLLAR